MADYSKKFRQVNYAYAHKNNSDGDLSPDSNIGYGPWATKEAAWAGLLEIFGATDEATDADDTTSGRIYIPIGIKVGVADFSSGAIKSDADITEYWLKGGHKYANLVEKGKSYTGGNGITIDGTNIIKVNPANGIEATTDGVKVKPGLGIAVDADGVRAKAANGISVDADGIKVVAKTDGGLQVGSEGLYIEFASDSDISDLNFDSESSDGKINITRTYDETNGDKLVFSVNTAISSTEDTTVMTIRGYDEQGGGTYTESSVISVVIPKGETSATYFLTDKTHKATNLFVAFMEGYSIGNIVDETPISEESNLTITEE